MVLSFAAARPVRRAALCLLILAGAAQAGAGPLVAPERKLKAACLYRVATFVDRPDAAFARAAARPARPVRGRLAQARPLAGDMVKP
ncbi:MAG: hypothetical protein ACJ8HJ_04685 [Massilia sp.]|jgi:hypothetical protein